MLEGAAQWTSGTSDLQDTLQTYDEMIQEEANLGATDLYLGRKAWAAFRKHPDVRDDLDRNNINIGQLSPSIQSKFKGVWNGLRIWLVTGTYKDIEGTVKHYLDPEYALLAAGDAQNVMEFGQPMDVDCTGPVEIFAKQFKQDDPSGIFTVAESRPLPWPKQPARPCSSRRWPDGRRNQGRAPARHPLMTASTSSCPEKQSRWTRARPTRSSARDYASPLYVAASTGTAAPSLKKNTKKGTPPAADASGVPAHNDGGEA